ncbi:DNA/RNA helicase domain-containing protein [Helicobacter cetorum]|uniref:DNA/RNA helicase domain-containing protein n=1 Tax=Helicobacter cetorum TaxID=138563 RepID=UPI000CF1AAB9|nr:DNA/RNA helicase domain-containing protein [Helicobacter cetorum]
MKPINLLSLAQAFDTLDENSYKNFLSCYDIQIEEHGIKKHKHEINSLKGLIQALNSNQTILHHFYVGYLIPQKEFDLLRFGENYIINIELKEQESEEKIQEQLIENKYYLSSLDKTIYCYTFTSSDSQLYYLNSNDTLEKIDFENLIEHLINQELQHIDNIDALFKPSNYLVSPFNDTEKFLENKYFLTDHQQMIQKDILQTLEKSPSTPFFSITGEAGTGKTLLTYDTAKKAIENNQKVLVIHCGNLNDGHHALNKQDKWEIISIKEYSNEDRMTKILTIKKDLSPYNLIIIDEVQRVRKNQLDSIISTIKKHNKKCIFSYDGKQTLSKKEIDANIPQIISSLPSIREYKLTNKIRTSQSIAAFIKMLLDKKENCQSDKQKINKDDIEITYFNNNKDVKVYLEILHKIHYKKDWKNLRFTPQLYIQEYEEYALSHISETAHEVIGQEFDQVCVVIDKYFYYDENHKLDYRNKSYYDTAKMLFQNLTRARNKIHLILLNNQELLNRCLSILNTTN